ncbi:cobalamin biosynthesis protein CobW [Clavibacter tessellarius]|uniref:Cobalamin biosynthesis protein CobW n=1 Tax=Clavibacter tessellarius TaxID=31965 RepID=A0A225CJ91_9MICO|nr:GTP-binding protein [Clavibacter michiganensis]OQJ62463.1 cobalamin biosynthesis protein CobW [Clavibacter michiganensis subsp. tessellarius]UKF34547.1 cobalamin biosynthesis protein CobW [Clavibacter michiganensis subsp. tessellarius]
MPARDRSTSVHPQPQPPSGVVLVVGEGSALRAVLRDAVAERAASLLVLPPDEADPVEPIARFLDDLAELGPGAEAVVGIPATADARATGMGLDLLLRQERRLQRALGGVGSGFGLRHVVSVVPADRLHAVSFGRVEDAFTEAETLVDLVEYATVVVLTGMARVPQEARGLVVALVRRLAPRATVLDARRPLALDRLPRWGDVAGLAASAGWMRELTAAGVAARPADLDRLTGPVGSVVVGDPRPLHPQRLADAVEEELRPDRAGLVLRSKGFVSLASRPGEVGGWSSVGPMLTLQPTGIDPWTEEAPHGTEIAFFGIGLRPAVLRRAIGRAVLTPAELAAGPDAWAGYADPFPRVDAG